MLSQERRRQRARPSPTKYPIPASDAKGVRGATVSYTRYDCNDARDAELGGGATLERDKTWNRFQITSQASDQTYVKMPVGRDRDMEHEYLWRRRDRALYDSRQT